MAVSRSPSATSLIPQVQKAGAGAIWGALTNLFSPRGTPRDVETQQTDIESPDPYAPDPPPSEPTAPSQSSPKAGTSQRSRLVPETKSSDDLPKERFPPVIVRDFANEPRPTILDRPIDERWVFKSSFPRNAVPGTHEREAKQWEVANSHLYRLGGNRADPPGVIPKTWGGLSKAEDEAMMRRAKNRLLEIRRKAEAIGLAPTEPNIGGPPPVFSFSEEDDRDAEARANAYIKEQEEKARAAGYGPSIKTPTNTPPPPQHRYVVGHYSPSPPSHPRTPSPPTRPRTPSPTRTSPRRSKRKRVESGSEPDDVNAMNSMGRASKRRSQKQDLEDAVTAEAGPSIPVRYSLRRRRANAMPTTHTSSPKASSLKKVNKGKGRAKAV